MAWPIRTRQRHSGKPRNDPRRCATDVTSPLPVQTRPRSAKHNRESHDIAAATDETEHARQAPFATPRPDDHGWSEEKAPSPDGSPSQA